MKNNTPANIRKALEQAKAYVDAHPNQPPLVTINSWNEWTETSYPEPDDLNGYGYLEAVREVFGARRMTLESELNGPTRSVGKVWGTGGPSGMMAA